MKSTFKTRLKWLGGCTGGTIIALLLAPILVALIPILWVICSLTIIFASDDFISTGLTKDVPETLIID